jgi:hypothetical protein
VDEQPRPGRGEEEDGGGESCLRCSVHGVASREGDERSAAGARPRARRRPGHG